MQRIIVITYTDPETGSSFRLAPMIVDASEVDATLDRIKAHADLDHYLVTVLTPASLADVLTHVDAINASL